MKKAIKKTRHVTLNQLRLYNYDHNLSGQTFISQNYNEVEFTEDGAIIDARCFIDGADDLFPLTVDMYISHDIEFELLEETYEDLKGNIDTCKHRHSSISQVLEEYPKNHRRHGTLTRKIYALLDDSLELIYDKSESQS